MNARFNAVDARFDAVEIRFNSVDARIDNLDRDVQFLNEPRNQSRQLTRLEPPIKQLLPQATFWHVMDGWVVQPRVPRRRERRPRPGQ